MEQSQKLDDLERLVSKLAKSKERTTRQLQGMKRDLHHNEAEAKEEKAKTSSSMSQLRVELNSIKETLRETRDREKQVRGLAGSEIRLVTVGIEPTTFGMLARCSVRSVRECDILKLSLVPPYINVI